MNEMNLLQQFTAFKSKRTGENIISHISAMIMLGMIGAAWIFFLPYYDASMKSAAELVGTTPSNPILPLTVMAISLVLIVGSQTVGLRLLGKLGSQLPPIAY